MDDPKEQRDQKDPKTGPGRRVTARFKWEPRWFIGGRKTGLLTFILGNEIELTAEAKAAYKALPDTFLEWITAEEPAGEPEERMAAE